MDALLNGVINVFFVLYPQMVLLQIHIITIQFKINHLFDYGKVMLFFSNLSQLLTPIYM